MCWPPMLTEVLTAPGVALTVPCADTAAQNTGKFIACSSATSRTPPVVTRPRTPRYRSAVASSSPNAPSVPGRGGGDHQDVTGTALLHRRVDHQVVTGPADHGDRGTADPRAQVDRADPRPEVAGAAHRLVHGGDAKGGQRVDFAEVCARAAGDHHVPHRSVPVTCG